MATYNRTGDDFIAKVINSDKYVLVDFWATWCKPCQMMAPVLDEISEDEHLADKLEVTKVNVEDPRNQVLVQAFQIQGIPNMKLFHGGKVVKEFVGFRPKSQLKAELMGMVN